MTGGLPAWSMIRKKPTVVRTRLAEVPPAPEERNVVLDRTHAHEAEHQAASQRTAVHPKSRWTKDDDTVLLNRADEPVHVIARDLGRTLRAVRARRWRLRQRE